MVERTSSSKTDRVLRAGARAHVAEAVKAREASDEIIKGWIVYLPLIAVVVGVGLGAMFALLVGGDIGIAFGVFSMFSLTSALLALLNYRLTRRLREHVRRENMLRRGTIEYLRSLVEEVGVAGKVETELSNLESIEREAAANEVVPNPFYAAMGVLPLVGVVITFLYLRPLTSIPPGHERRWQAFIAQSAAIGKVANLNMMFSAAVQSTRKRRFLVYLVLAVVFVPFLVYWYSKLISELNAHFEQQWRDEDHLHRELG
ncbi:MAG TPA: hypothetical protein VMB46_02915 [Methanomassiliicoccales archaeon]|nr:hypothetical protein [Methanomassiliicoccales archaeon]